MKSFSKTVCAIILGAGKGARAALGYNKVLFRDNDQSVIKTATDKFSFCDKIIIVCPEDEKATFDALFPVNKGFTVVCGGNTRSESVRLALPYCDCEIVAIHDGARPYVSESLVRACIEDAIEYGSSVPCIKANVAIKETCGDTAKSVDRSKILFVQTPQVFNTEKIKAAYSSIPGDYADDSEIFEKAGYPVHVTPGEASNVKLTNPEDFKLKQRIGSGYDVHRLVENRKLILGGVEIPFEKGLLGHSDADVLTHAVMDALLSAAGLPDIGVLFPDNDPETENISSMILLSRVLEKIKHVRIINLSAVIMAQKPKLAGFIHSIRESLSSALGLPVDCVNVSATTTEGLGIVGECKGIAASATALIEI